MKKKLLIMLLCMTTALGLSACGEKQDVDVFESETTEKSDAKALEQLETEILESMEDGTSENSVSNEVPLEDDGIVDMDIEVGTFKYTGHELGVDYMDNQCLIVYFEFTNNSGETVSSGNTFMAQAFQNGVQCDYTSVENGINEAADNLDKNVQDGTTINVAFVYEISDLSDVIIEALPLMNFENIKDSQTLELQ